MKNRIAKRTRRQRGTDNMLTDERLRREYAAQEVARLKNLLVTALVPKAGHISQLDQAQVTQQTYRTSLQSLYVALNHFGDVSPLYETNIAAKERSAVNRVTSDLREFRIMSSTPPPLPIAPANDSASTTQSNPMNGTGADP